MAGSEPARLLFVRHLLGNEVVPPLPRAAQVPVGKPDHPPLVLGDEEAKPRTLHVPRQDLAHAVPGGSRPDLRDLLRPREHLPRRERPDVYANSVQTAHASAIRSPSNRLMMIANA